MAGPRRSLAAALWAAVCSAAVLASAAAARGDQAPIVIGTGPVAGTYFPVGGAICNVFNRAHDADGRRCLVQSTTGSRDNLMRLARGEIDFALIQSDWQYLALNGGAGDDMAPMPELRAVLSLQAHALAVMVGPDAGISDLAELKGRRVNLGPAGSGMRAAAEALLAALDWSRNDLSEVAELGVGEVGAALCDGRIDAFILPVSHPEGTIAGAATACGARLLSVPEQTVAHLVGDWPFYAPSSIPAGVYSGQDAPVYSYGVRATLVTLAGEPEDRVFALTEAVLADLDRFTAQLPVLSFLTREEMFSAGRVAEIHAGAARYFQNSGKE